MHNRAALSVFYLALVVAPTNVGGAHGIPPAPRFDAKTPNVGTGYSCSSADLSKDTSGNAYYSFCAQPNGHSPQPHILTFDT